MELWIRTKDRECLTKVNHLYIYHKDNNIYEITQQNDISLGEYKTKKRALEVLDEIQNLLNPMIIFNNCKCTQDVIESIKEAGACFATNDAHIEQVSTCVYEMPEE